MTEFEFAGRESGLSRSSDGRLDIKLSTPDTGDIGTNPEQLFAAGWSACFEGAMAIAARKMKIVLPAEPAVDAEVDLCLTDAGYSLQTRLNVSLPGLEREVALIMNVHNRRSSRSSRMFRCINGIRIDIHT